MPTRRGNGTSIDPTGIVEIRKGDGTVLWSPNRFDDFEGSSSHWDWYSTGRTADSWSFTHTDKAYSGSYSAYAANDTGVNGNGGLSRQYDMARAEILEFQVQYNIDVWGRIAVILEDSNGFHTIWQVKSSGDATSTDSWQSVSVDISDHDDQFRLLFGNDDAGSNATYTDHGFEIWIDDVLIE